PILLVVPEVMALKEFASDDRLEKSETDARRPTAANIASDKSSCRQPFGCREVSRREHGLPCTHVSFRAQQEIIGDDISVAEFPLPQQRLDPMRRESIVGIE